MQPNLLPIFLSLSTIVKFVVNTFEKEEWTSLNTELKIKLAPINHHINRAHVPEDIVILGDQANAVIRNFLLEHPDQFEAVEPTKKSKFINHPSKTLEEATELKKELKKKAFSKDATNDDKKRFRQALRAISDLKKAEKRRQQQR